MNKNIQTNSKIFQSVLFSGFGLFVLCLTIPKLTRLHFQFLSAIRATNGGLTSAKIVWRFAGEHWIPLVGLLVQVLLGVGLFLGGSRLFMFWRYIRAMTKRPDMDVSP